MAEYKSYINALRECAKEHKYDIVPFAHIRTTDLCNDTADLLEKLERKRTIDADELLKRIAEKCKTPSLSEDTVNGLCGATAIIYDMLNESEDKE